MARVYKAINGKVNMCDGCKMEIPTCPKATVIEFGDGVGNDNVTACSEFIGKLVGGQSDIAFLDKSYGVVKRAQ